MIRRLAFVAVFLTALPLAAQDEDGGFLNLLDNDIRWANESGSFNLMFSGMFDLELFVTEDKAPGLLFEDDSFINRRFILFVDATIGKELYFFLQTRADRGLDPDSENSPDVRLDEAFVRYTIEYDGWTASLQLGKFATPLGNFAPRHDSFKNALVRAPMIYDHVVGVGDNKAIPNNNAVINRRVLEDNKTDWVTMIWGPVYHTGALAVIHVGNFDVRAAITGSAPSERPADWGWRGNDAAEELAAAGRLGWIPFIGFKTGFNIAVGPYLRDRAEKTLPVGRERGDYPQKLIGIDAEYSFGHWVLFAELFQSEWEIPNVSGDVRVVGGYVEGKYSFSHRLYAAARVNVMIFNEIEDLAGADRHWDWNAWRLELGTGYRFEENLIGKIEIEINKSAGTKDEDDNLLAASLSISF